MLEVVFCVSQVLNALLRVLEVLEDAGGGVLSIMCAVGAGGFTLHAVGDGGFALYTVGDGGYALRAVGAPGHAGDYALHFLSVGGCALYAVMPEWSKA